MAETTTVDSTITRVKSGRSENGAAPDVVRRLHVRVDSIRADRADVSVVRDFVRALDEAAAPGKVLFDVRRGDAGHPIQLVAEWDEDLPEQEEQS